MTAELPPSASPRRVTGSNRAVAGPIATLLVIAAAIGMWYAWFAWAARCDDTCVGARYQSPPAGASWDDYLSSWQWSGQFGLAVTGFLLTVAARVAIARGHGRLATGLFAIAAAVFAYWTVFLPDRYPIL
jgi:hypothetical protein